MKIERHPFQRTIGKTRNGRDLKAWYFWYLDSSGKQVIRTCGTRNKPCMLRRDADAFIAQLEEEDEKKGLAEVQAIAGYKTIQDVAALMYIDKSEHMQYRTTWKRSIKESTRKEGRSYLDRWILPYWGRFAPTEVTALEFKNWLPTLRKTKLNQETGLKDEIELSSSTKNRIVEIFNELMDECVRLKTITVKPEIPHLKRQSRRKDILYIPDMINLFPAGNEALAKVWGRPGEDSRIGLCFGAMAKLMVSTGLRPGEACAITLDQITLDQSGIIIDKMVDVSGNIVHHLKCGDDEEDPRLRVAKIPSETGKTLKAWIKARPKTDGNELFHYSGLRIREDYLRKRFALALANAGISTAERNLTPHSLRFTYTSRMRRLIPGETLRTMTGHLSQKMTDYYTRSELMAELASLQEYEKDIDRFWA